MPTPSGYQIKLNPKILSRAKIILGSLLTLTIVLLVAGIYQGIQSGEFNKVFIKPFKEFASEMAKVTQPIPEPTLTPLTIPTPPATTSTSTTKVIINQPAPAVKQPQPVVSNCIRKNIREGEFASNKCYSGQDYEDLNYYLNQYNSAVSSVSFYNTKVNISCSNNDFFKTCEQDKKEQQTNLDNIPRYRSIIQGIIAKGQ